ncbi:MAG: hypothetical protein DPW16_17490 [Chloroflexi bacterium]|nr:hypothetical protein [Chloroflexota bacterium]
MANQTPLDLPVPEDPIAQIHALAYDLAYGAINNKWSSIFDVADNQFVNTEDTSEDLNSYLTVKWKLDYPNIEFLDVLNYLRKISHRIAISKIDGRQVSVDCYRITDKAISLLEKAFPASIFISYNRQQSSVFALLILQTLKQEGLGVFLDIRNIAPGDNWHGLIEEEVKKRENFICLLGPDTLQSPYVRKEIRWAAQDKDKKRIIPIFHNNFKPEDFKDEEFQDLLTYNAIVVTEETAIAYESALLQLLNYFGRTP